MRGWGGQPWRQRTAGWKRHENVLHVGAGFSQEQLSVCPEKPLFHVILLKGQSKAPAPLDAHLTLLLVGGRPPVPKHVTHRQDMPEDKQPRVGSSAPFVCDDAQQSRWRGWRMVKSCCMNRIFSSCARFHVSGRYLPHGREMWLHCLITDFLTSLFLLEMFS